jgi:hypothetical protein
MMTQFVIKNTLTLTLFVASILTPAAYAGHQPVLFASTQALVESSADSPKRVSSIPFARTELFFGTAKPDGTAVTEEEWGRFLDEEVTPRFPDGLTVLSGIGQFRGSNGEIIQETSIVLILLYPVETRKSSSKKIEEIREAYKQAFRQESVLRVDDRRPAKISF